MGIILFILNNVGRKVFDAAWAWCRIHVVNRILRRELSEQAKNIAYALDIFSTPRIKPAQFTTKIIGRIERTEIQEIMAAWQGGIDGILLVGEAGSGKSGIAHNIGSSLQQNRSPLLFMDATELASQKKLIAYITDLLPIDLKLIHAYKILGEEQECFFIIDQLDSICNTEAFIDILSLLKSLVQLRGVRVLAISRLYEANEIKELKELDLRRIYSDDLLRKSAERYLLELGFLSPSELMVDLAQNLLNLSLIAEIIDVKGNFIGITSETGLWERYIETIREREGEEVLNFALDLASTTLMEHGATFPGLIVPKKEIRKLLSRGILISSSFLRLRFRHERLQEFLCAYSLFPERPQAIEIYDQYGEVIGRRIIQWLHSLLHIHDPNEEAIFVSDILSRSEEELPFYSRVVVLDALREQEDPCKQVAEIFLPHLTNEIYEKYFFRDLENNAWGPLLHEVGYFLRPPEPIEVSPGSYRFPLWGGGTYLIGIAEQYPHIVAETALKVQSNNGYVLDNLLEALLKIPAAFGAEAAQNISQWTPTLRGFFDPLKLGQFVGYLAENNHVIEGLHILEALLTPIISENDKSSEKIRYRLAATRSRVDDYWLREIWNTYGTRVMSIAPIDVVGMLERKIVQSIELEHELYGIPKGESSHSSWRSAIEDHPQNTSLHKLNDLLVDGLRDAVEQICGVNQTVGELLLFRYLTSHHSILQRIALHTLGQFGLLYPDILADVFRERVVLNDSGLHHEIHRLLTDQFLNLDPEAKRRIIEWLSDGPEDKKEILSWISQREGVKNAEEELARYCDYWTIRRMWAIRNYLEGDDKERFNALVAKYEEPDHPDFLSWASSVGPITHISPLTKDELLEASFEEIEKELKGYKPESPSIEHSREGPAEALQAAVIEKPEHFITFSKNLINSDIRLIYTYHFLMGVRQVIEQGVETNYTPLLDLFDFIVGLKEDPFEGDLDRYEAGLRAAQLEVANLIESLLKADMPSLDTKILERIQSIIQILLDNPDPSDNPEERSGWDPATRSLNTVRGKAMHGIIELARYVDRQLKNEASSKKKSHNPLLDPFVKNQLTRKLDKSVDKSLEVHSVFGWYTPLLEYLDHEWFVEALPRIFPGKPKLSLYWDAAWDAYISFNRVWKPTFEILIPQYQRAVRRLSEQEDDGRLGTSTGQRLAEHLSFAYVNELIDFDTDDELLVSFFNRANDDLRGHVAFWLVKAFDQIDLNQDNKIWQRMWTLMRKRITTTAEDNNIEAYRSEVSEYMRWLEKAPVTFNDVEPLIRMAIPFLKEGYYKKLVIDYLAKHCEEYPYETVELLHAVLRLVEMGWFTLHEENVGRILKFATGSGNEQAKEEAVILINFLGERGDFKWKKYLPIE